MKERAKVLRLLGDPTRLTILKLLEIKECCVCEFVEIFHISQPTVSQHMRRLREIQLVNERRSGKWYLYSINKKSEHFPLLLGVLKHLPSQQEKIKKLERKGVTIICE